jgi:glycosyltransferase involved in cell wall biosynthesis
MKRISLVLPFFNEEANVAATLEAIEEMTRLPGYAWEVVAINDGSSDRTLDRLVAYEPKGFELLVVDLSRNFGKEAALSAGLAHATGDAVVPIDADLQDPPSLIPAMIEQWEKGSDVVLGRRSDRSTDSLVKRNSAAAFYWVINRVSDVRIPENVGDFRLMDRAVVEVLKQLPETRRFMKGLFAWAGFKTSYIDYARPERTSGSSKFNGWKLWNLAVEGITSFSTAPLRVWTYIGLLVATLAFMYGSYIVGRTIVQGVDVPGYASLLTIMLFLAGIQLVGLGVLGEYVGRTYIEAKRRPPFVVRRVVRRGGETDCARV